MSPEELAAAGEALYGPLWQSELARQLDVRLVSMQRWASGRAAMRPETAAGLRREIVALLRERGAACLALAERMGAAAESSAPRDDGGQQHRA